MSKLTSITKIFQSPGSLKVKITFKIPNENFTSIKIFRRTDEYQIDPNDSKGLLIHEEIFDANKLNTEITIIDDNNIIGDNIYYYSAITITNDGYYFGSVSQKNIPIVNLSGLEQKLYDIQPKALKVNDSEEQYKKFVKVVAKFIEYIHGRTKLLEIIFNPEKMPPEVFKNLAEQMGWHIDPRLSLDIQRKLIPNITYFYKWSGTNNGLNKLVKFYSGYPDNTGIIEGSNKLLFSPRFIDGQVTFSERTAVNFINDDLTKIDTADDPLYYCYDFSDVSRFNLTQKFTVYFQKPINMQDSKVNKIVSILDSLLDEHAPLGTTYEILVY